MANSTNPPLTMFKRPGGIRRKKSSGGSNIGQVVTGLLLSMAVLWIVGSLIILFHTINGSYNSKSSTGLQQNSGSSNSNSVANAVAAAILPNYHSPHHVVNADNLSNNLRPFESPLFIFTCNRNEYLDKTLSYIHQYIPKNCIMGCPIIISQDGSSQKVIDVINKWSKEFQTIKIPLIHIQHKKYTKNNKIF